MSIKIERNN